MKKFILLILSFPLVAFAAVFDFSGGVPAVMDDGVVSDTFEQTKYDFSSGVPAPVFDSTATQAQTSSDNGVKVNNGGIIINNGGLIIQ
jgi:hypothetical protein